MLKIVTYHSPTSLDEATALLAEEGRTVIAGGTDLLVNPRCGLLFLDIADGTALQIEGVASVQWQGERRIDVAIEACEESSVLPS